MIVVDSSVWIANLRNIDTASVRMLRAMKEDDDVIVGDLVMLEVLQGARNEEHAARIERDLRRFRIVEMMDTDVALRAARNYRYLCRLGVSVRKTIDMIIATFCIEGGHQLLHRDRDFSHFEIHLGLQVLR